MDETLKNFSEQFLFKPVIENRERLTPKDSTLVAGMGGSVLGASLLQMIHPTLPLTIHRDYGLPEGDFNNTLTVICSYSGNTEETVNAFEEAQRRDVAVAVITSGGQLLKRAQEAQVPYIKLPEGHFPRLTIGYYTVALAELLNLSGMRESFVRLAEALPSTEEVSDHGKVLAKKLQGKVPLIYSSAQNSSLSYVWKINIAESGKVPCFRNTFPELNHNEMAGLLGGDTEDLVKIFSFIFLIDETDGPHVQKRMNVLRELYKEKGYLVHDVILEGANIVEKIFGNVLLAMWTSYHLGVFLKHDPGPLLLDEFKRRMREE
jgi:glucose/mannose-6-phosphate isomerase